jgi:hypothetical protein
MLVVILHEEIPAPPSGQRLVGALSALLVRDPARRATSEQVRYLLGSAPIPPALPVPGAASIPGAAPIPGAAGPTAIAGTTNPEPEDTRVMPSSPNAGAEAAPTLAMVGAPTPPRQGPPPVKASGPKRGPGN